MLTAPWTRELLMPKLRASAVAAAKQCNPGKGGCGLRWWRNGVNDGEVGVGEQMSALEVMQNLLIDEVAGPVGEKTGGISKNDPSAGTGDNVLAIEHDAITTADKFGAGMVTAFLIIGVLAGGWFMITSE
jgi:mannan endo-1,6-alpha-mannosidase